MSQQAFSTLVATGLPESIYDSLQDRSSAAFFLSFPPLYIVAMRLLVLSLFLGSVTATPLEYLQGSISESHSDYGGWYDPRLSGGRFLDFTTPTKGEPLNIIISGLSDSYILNERGFHDYAKSLGYSGECLGLHYGNIHQANLGDGDGRKSEVFLARQYYFPIWGTCWESVAGGQHFRAWKQNGTLANSGAWFIGASKELDSSKHHDIAPNGYNLGRDWLVKRAVHGGRWKGRWWKAEVEWRTNLIDEGSDGVNHGIAQDGRVAILTVHRL